MTIVDENRTACKSQPPAWAVTSRSHDLDEYVMIEHSAGAQEIGAFDANVVPGPGPVSIELVQYDTEGFPRVEINTLDTYVSLTTEGARAVAQALIEAADVAESSQR